MNPEPDDSISPLPSDPASEVDLRKLPPEQRLAAFRRQLTSPPERTIRYRETNLIPTIGLFGTAGESQWRQELKIEYQRVLAALEEDQQELFTRVGIDTASLSDIVYDPQHQVGVRNDTHVDLESHHLTNDAVIVFGLTEEYSSIGSMAELGFLAAVSLLKSKKAMAFVRSADPKLGKDIARVRTLAAADARYIHSMIPRHLIFRNDLEQVKLSSINEAAEFVEFLASPVREDVTKRFLPRGDIQNRVVLSGTSKKGGKELQSKLNAELQRRSVPVISTAHDSWSQDIYISEELPLKDTSSINTVVISDPNSFGAVKDVGLAFFRAITSGTYALIHIPPNDEPEEYKRARDLIIAHWNRIANEFPWVTHYVHFVEEPMEIADYAEAIYNSLSS